MWERKGSIGFMVFCMLLVVLCWQMPARAAVIPPTIGEIVGTYSVSDKEVYYEFYEGIPRKDYYVGKDTLTWRITQASESTVEVYIDEWDWLFTAYYKNGFLVQSLHDIEGVGVGIALFSGKPSKVKFKGDFGWGQFGGLDEYCEWDPYMGKMVSTDPGFLVGSNVASQHDEQTVFALGEEAVSLAAASILGVNDLPGTYSCRLTGTMYHPTAGMKEKGSLSNIVTITKLDDQTLNINSPDGDMRAHYETGILMVADVDDGSVLDTNARFGILLAKGKPGKISLKGKIYSITDLGAPDDEFEVAKVSCKQVSP
jgi:hypothetical protein